MPKYDLPRNYLQAAERSLNSARPIGRGPGVTLFDGILFRREAGGDGGGAGGAASAVAVVADGVPIVTFHANGAVKVCTFGTNTRHVISRINACLPRPYRVRKRKEGHHLLLIDQRRPEVPVAEFLSSHTFTPEPAPAPVATAATAPPAAAAPAATTRERETCCAR